MATKKPASKFAGKNIVKWDEELARMAEASAGIEASVGAGGTYIKTRGGQLEYNGATVPGNKMNVIILDHVLENAYYADRYDSENPQPPNCYALGRDDDEMSPHEQVEEPQHDACATCPMNQWGSADTGAGKACKNTRRLALLPEDALEDIAKAEVALIKVPVTSVKGWAGYVRQLKDQLKRPPMGVITEISLVPDPKTQFKMLFKLIGTIDDGDSIGELVDKRKTVEAQLMAPYAPAEERPAPARRGASKVGRQQTPPPAKRPPAKAAARRR